MTIPAMSIVKAAATVLQDLDGVRWSAAELVDWLNAGQREIQIYRPDATAKTVDGTLAAGPRQVLTSIAEVNAIKPLRLIEVTRNTSTLSARGAITLAEKDDIDAVDPEWYALPGSVDIEHFMVDAREPMAFYVYPPALAGAKVEITVSTSPTDVPAPVGNAYTSVTGNIDVADNFANALVDYILHRAFLKDTEFAADVNRAVAHYNAFGNALGVEMRAGVLVASNPLSPGNN